MLFTGPVNETSVLASIEQNYPATEHHENDSMDLGIFEFPRDDQCIYQEPDIVPFAVHGLNIRFRDIPAGLLAAFDSYPYDLSLGSSRPHGPRIRVG